MQKLIVLKMIRHLYEGVKEEDFEKFSKPSNWHDLKTERLELYKNTFIGDAEKESDRDKYLNEVY